MGDPLSITASLIAILQATTVAVNYFRGVRHAAKDIRDIMDELKSLNTILTSLCDYASENPDSTLQTFDTPLRKCLRETIELHAKLAKSFCRRGMSRLRWPLIGKECLEYLNKIGRFKSDILLGLSVEQDNRSRRTLEEITGGQIRTKILNWLDPTVYDERHREISARRQMNTGEWLLKEGVVVDWTRGNSVSRILWGHGIPGAGKTFLSSLMIDDLRSRATAANWGVTFMYFNHSEQNQQTPTFFLSSLVKQFVCQITNIPEEVSKLYKKLQHKQERPTFRELYSLLLDVTKGFAQTFVICDALDECDQYAQRRELLPLFHQMETAGIRLFLTSREHPEDIRRALASASKIKLLAQKKDIRVYIERKITENPRADSLVKHMKCKEEIISKLERYANGIYLCEQTTPRQLLNAIGALAASGPPSMKSPMDPTYNRAMETIQSQPKSSVELAVNILTWLVKSQRVLTIRELQQAVSVEHHQTTFDELALPSRDTMVDVCASLISIDQESNTVRLVHYTVKEFLTNNASILKDAEFRLVMACATFLSYDDFSGNFPDTPPKNVYPFWVYASLHFRFHLGQCDEALSLDLVLRFIKKRVNVLSYLMATMGSHYGNTIYLSDSYPLLHLVVLLRHNSATRSLLKQGADVLARDNKGQTALHIAVCHMDEPTIRVLIEEGADASARDCKGHTPLYLAMMEQGMSESIVWLLADRADLTVTNNARETPLHMATSCGNRELVRMMLEKGADVTAPTNEGDTPLHIAVYHVDQELVGMLLEKCANVSVTDHNGQTPLHVAARYCSPEVARILIEKGADVSASTNEGNTPLHIAVYHVQQALVRILIEKGANISATDKEGMTPLHIAVCGWSQEVVRFLIEKGADVSASANEGHTPLHLAVYHEEWELVKILIEKGANISATDNEGKTPLYIAASSRSKELTKFLIERGADVSALTIAGYTPLHTTMYHEELELVRVLIKEDVNISITDNEGKTPMLRVEEANSSIAKIRPTYLIELAESVRAAFLIRCYCIPCASSRYVPPPAVIEDLTLEDD